MLTPGLMGSEFEDINTIEEKKKSEKEEKGNSSNMDQSRNFVIWHDLDKKGEYSLKKGDFG